MKVAGPGFISSQIFVAFAACVNSQEIQTAQSDDLPALIRDACIFDIVAGWDKHTFLFNIQPLIYHSFLKTTACKCTWPTHPHFSPCRAEHIVQFTNIYLLCEFNRLFAAVCTTRYAIYLKPKFAEEQYNPSSAQEGAVVHSCQSLGCLSVAPTQTFETSADCKGCVCAFHQM